MGLVRAGLSMALALAGIGRKALHTHALYTLGLVAASRMFGRERGRIAGDAGDGALPRIAALVVAHDEESVIGACVESLQAQRYPSDRFEVFVVADHCNDRTAELARSAGAAVLERSGGKADGKPAAVAFGVEQLQAFDAVALFDADNVVDPGFLAAMGARLAAGEKVVQGFVDAKNPDASWVSAASAIGFWAIDGLGQRPRERLGLSAGLMGTGFVARSEVLREVLPPSDALADDLEMSARLALRGVRVAYEPDARTLDEKPTAMETAAAQRRRWMQGRWRACERWLPALIADGRLRSLDVAVQMVSPSLLFTATALGAVSGAELVLRAVTGIGGTSAARRGIAAAALYFLLPVPAVARQRPSAAVWRAYVMQPRYLLQSLPIAIKGWASRGEKGWVRGRQGAMG